MVLASEQHKEYTHSRLKRDNDGVIKLLLFIEKRNSSCEDKVLRNIVNGIKALGPCQCWQLQECKRIYFGNHE